MKANTTTEKVLVTTTVDEERVTLTMKREEAELLMAVLMRAVRWSGDAVGCMARDAYGALEVAGVDENLSWHNYDTKLHTYVTTWSQVKR